MSIQINVSFGLDPQEAQQAIRTIQALFQGPAAVDNSSTSVAPAAPVAQTTPAVPATPAAPAAPAALAAPATPAPQATPAAPAAPAAPATQTTPAAPAHSLEEVKAILKRVALEVDRDKALSILAKHGADAISKLAESAFDAAYTEAEALLKTAAAAKSAENDDPFSS